MNKDLYYDALSALQTGWHEGEDNLRELLASGELKREWVGKSTCYYRT